MAVYHILLLILGCIIVVAIALLVFYRFFFLRRPERRVPKGRLLVSPAYGKIVRILKIDDKDRVRITKGLLGKVDLLTKDVIRKGYVIVIMMTPLDVHYQRSPVDGTVEKVIYRKGKFLNAVADARSLQCLQNENNATIIRNGDIGKVKVVQVAGFLARRISCFIKPKQKIHKGEVFGLISLGSQVILVIPELELKVREGQKVVEGETVIAKY